MAYKKSSKADRLTSEQLNALLSYDSDTGKLYWKKRDVSWFEPSKTRSVEHICNNWNSLYEGKEALYHKDMKGYAYGSILSVRYRAHNVIWCMHTGNWPIGVIDHIDNDSENNRIENMREATLSQNSHNSKNPANNTSGFKGASFHKQSGRWIAKIKCGRKRIHLGMFNCVTSAHFAYVAASKKYHGEFGRIA